MNLLVMDCKPSIGRNGQGYRHQVLVCSGKSIIKEFDNSFHQITGPEWVEEFRLNPLMFMLKYAITEEK